MTTPSELAKCPFCGYSDAFVERADYSSCYVQCNHCMAQGPTECQESDAEEIPGERPAKEQWNRRALLDVREGWVSVEDRLPENDEEMLVYPRDDHVTAQYWPWPPNKVGNKPGAWFVIDADGYRNPVRVTHWMPLPVKPQSPSTTESTKRSRLAAAKGEGNG